MRAFILWILLASLGVPLRSEPVYKIDKSQGEAALRLIREGDTVRLYCKPCADVVYTRVEVRERTLNPVADRYQLLVNGGAVNVAGVYMDSGYGDGWESLAELLGVVAEGVTREMPKSLDEESSLLPHAGRYRGTVGGDAVRLELVLAERKLTGSYVHEAGGRAFRLSATSFNATHRSETLVLIERGEGDLVTATLSGELDAESGSFTGTRSPLGGSEAQPFLLSREAP